MADFEFTTVNPYIKGRIRTTVDRDPTSYTVHYEVSLRRTNSYTGKATQGTLHYKIFLNNKVEREFSQWFIVPNGGAYIKVWEGQKTFSLGALDTTDYTVGIWAENPSNGIDKIVITGYMISEQHSVKYKVPAYATPVGASTITVQDTKSNKIRITGTVGADGTSLDSTKLNAAQYCNIYYTMDGSTPSDKNGKKLEIKKPAGGKLAFDIPFEDGHFILKVKAMTQGKYGGPTWSKEVSSTDFTHYRAPTNDEKPIIKLYRDAEHLSSSAILTPNKHIVVSWNNAGIDYSNSPKTGCKVYVHIYKAKDKKWYSFDFYTGKFLASDEVGNKYFVLNYPGTMTHTLLLTAKQLTLTKGDMLKVGIAPEHRHKNIDNTDSVWTGPIMWADVLTVKTSVPMTVKTPLGWEEGQVFIYTAKTDKSGNIIFDDDGNMTCEWIECDTIYVYTHNGWKESI